MADDSTTQGSRSDLARDPSARPSTDPLAELARLIGQDDVFEQMRRDAARAGYGAATEPAHAEEVSAPAAHEWSRPEPALRPTFDPHPHEPAAQAHHESAAPAPRAYEPPQAYAGRHFDAPGQPQYEAASALPETAYATRAEHADPYYADPAADPAAYDPAYGYDDGYVEEPPPARRRGGFVAIATVLGIAALGTAGVFGYRAYTGGESGQPPVIKASTTPAKVAPATQGREQAGRTTYDRTDKTQPERVVSREEQPIELKEARSSARRMIPATGPSAGMVGLTGQSPGAMTAPVQTADDPNQPRRVKTISIRPDGSVAPEPATPRAARTTAPTVATAAPARTASIPPAAAAPTAAAGTHVVQVASQKSEADAQASFRSLQAKYPDVLGARQPLIRRIDLGERGIFYRVQVGPFASIGEANEMCGNLKAAGGQCIVQRN